MKTTDVRFVIDLDQEFSVSLAITSQFSGNPADGWRCVSAIADAHGVWFCAAGPLVMTPCHEDLTNWLRQHIKQVEARRSEVWVRAQSESIWEEMTLSQLLLRQWGDDRQAAIDERREPRLEDQYAAPVFGAEAVPV